MSHAPETPDESSASSTGGISYVPTANSGSRSVNPSGERSYNPPVETRYVNVDSCTIVHRLFNFEGLDSHTDPQRGHDSPSKTPIDLDVSRFAPDYIL